MAILSMIIAFIPVCAIHVPAMSLRWIVSGVLFHERRTYPAGPAPTMRTSVLSELCVILRLDLKFTKSG
ncbi:unnamed protein product [Penicillium roqueforti FM164]|uniref:Genomic scaffold, ProqFM164S02 n=1 Tax=Penicillium roqueforti (strain FM164) TaxID=1365484 RepID=W6QQF8_PENRF|nr:unnamed protein product [Penicillium roqueforti FM164]